MAGDLSEHVWIMKVDHLEAIYKFSINEEKLKGGMKDEREESMPEC